jgi:hypothetical protein
MNINDEPLERCGLCYTTCTCYRTLNDQPYCGSTGKLITKGIYCHALKSTKGTTLINPFDNFPNKIKSDGWRTPELINEIGQSNYNILLKCANRRGLFEAFIHKTVHEFNWFIKVITIGNISTDDEYKYLYDKYNRYNSESIDTLVEQFEDYCNERYRG